jgi:hypothetical protein
MEGCRFDGAMINFCSHSTTAEILRQAASDDPEKLEVSRINLAHRNWNFQQFAELLHPQWPWAMRVLRQFCRADDPHVHPQIALGLGPRPSYGQEAWAGRGRRRRRSSGKSRLTATIEANGNDSAELGLEAGL